MIETTTETTTGPDVVELLIGQHMRIRDLFARVEESEGARRREAFADLVRMLAVHETAEELVVHPAARAAIEGGDDVVDDRLAEENHAKHLLKRLDDAGPDAPEFPDLLELLRVAVLDHASHEEQHEFRYLRRNLSPDRLAALAGAVRAAEKFAPTHPHPGAESATANLAAGPALAVFDRVKDAVRAAVGDSDR
ncbi:hemerythrin domain-containing protein [Actinokineospora iranica]|uniref:Hemerythrin HHE cation binding domain-containing protein n=1 Tax=Actinokineospora iranica TaxID=1271860 RepID=A0A1G6K049_9PSEU|nr:hemerythrin domain-containing protein [Actinokineospora iranica]SDC24015.1 Hemerythrin HHE cation binding domain-containing protein [Actinokineospora iranica]